MTVAAFFSCMQASKEWKRQCVYSFYIPSRNLGGQKVIAQSFSLAKMVGNLHIYLLKLGSPTVKGQRGRKGVGG